MSSRNFNAVPPPSNLNRRQTYTRTDDVEARPYDRQQTTAFKSALGRRTRFHSDDDYFEDDDDHHPPTEDTSGDGDEGDDKDDDEVDPLDAFMADLAKAEEKGSKKTKAKPAPTAPMASKVVPSTATTVQEKNKGVRHDIEEEDAQESYYRFMEENPDAGVGTYASGSDAEEEPVEMSGDRQVEYDQDGNPIVPTGRKNIDPLPMVYHSQIDYSKFERNFYNEHDEIAKLTPAEVEALRFKLGLKVSGPDPPKPVTSFAHFGFDENLLKVIRKLEYAQPTPIQAQAIPVGLSGRDVIGIAMTGSGKTAAFVWPLLVHILDQPQLRAGDGPIGLILAPTRELSQQIYTEAQRFAKPYGIRVVCTYGGGSKYEQAKDLEMGAEILVGTPGRIIDFVKMKATNFLRVTYLVLDEADRMFDMGFEPQVRSICNHVRPDRQTLMFSATFKKKIESLARDALNDPIRIVQGEIGIANQDITQRVHIFRSGTTDKWDWLLANLVEFTSQGSVLIFVTKKANSQELAANLVAATNFHPLLLHGDMSQVERNQVITSFKRKESEILVATDVAARGLDIPHIRTVVNYDMALDIDTHTHRIGRTGRAGETGVAYTLVTDKDKEMVGHLVRNLEGGGQVVTEELMKLALESAWFHKSRFKGGVGKSSGGPGGQRNRMGLGAAKFGSSSSSGGGYLRGFTPAKLPISSKLALTPGASGGNSEATAKLDTIKSMFRSQFSGQFKSATDTNWKSKVLGSEKTEQSGDESTKKKSRWG